MILCNISSFWISHNLHVKYWVINNDVVDCAGATVSMDIGADWTWGLAAAA